MQQGKEAKMRFLTLANSEKILDTIKIATFKMHTQNVKGFQNKYIKFLLNSAK